MRFGQALLQFSDKFFNLLDVGRVGLEREVMAIEVQRLARFAQLLLFDDRQVQQGGRVVGAAPEGFPE